MDGVILKGGSIMPLYSGFSPESAAIIIEAFQFITAKIKEDLVRKKETVNESITK